MKVNLVGPFSRNAPFGTESAFKKGLERIGVEVTAADTGDASTMILSEDADATVVFKWAEGHEHLLKSLKGPKIVYQPDDARFRHIAEMVVDMRQHCDFLLSFDDYGAGLGRAIGYKKSETMLLTADDDVYYRESKVEKDIDVSFVGNLSNPTNHASRAKMCRIAATIAKQRGWNTLFTVNNDPHTVRNIYNRSKVVLNHATDLGQSFGHGFGIQCRHFEVGLTGACLLSNKIIPKKSNLLYHFFESEEMLESKLISLVEDEMFRCLSASFLNDQVFESHLPQHRAAELVNFIERIS